MNRLFIASGYSIDRQPKISALTLFTLITVALAFYLLTNSALARGIRSSCLNEHSASNMAVHCEILARGYTALPKSHEFVKLSELHQYLMLKRAAKRFGIALEKPEPTSAADRTETVEWPLESRSFAGARCNAQPTILSCDGTSYRRVKNSQSSKSTTGFTSNELPSIRFYSLSPESFKQPYASYLSVLYRLGILDTAMSYTRFVGIAEAILDSSAQSLGMLNERFELMSQQLQEDRRSMRPPSLTTKAKPPDGVVCDPYALQIPQENGLDSKMPKSATQKFTAKTIQVCDDVQNTWVYE